MNPFSMKVASFLPTEGVGTHLRQSGNTRDLRIVAIYSGIQDIRAHQIPRGLSITCAGQHGAKYVRVSHTSEVSQSIM